MSNVRERIVTAALKLLETSGVGKFAQPQVAKEAGVPQGHLTYYFPKRTDLLRAVAARFVEALRDEVPAFFAEHIDEALEKQAMAFVRRLVKNRKRTRVVIGLVVTSEEDEGLRKQLADDVETSRKIAARMMGRDIDDPDVDITLATFWGLAIMHLVLEGRRTDAVTDRIIARFMEFKVDSPEVRPPREPAPPPKKATAAPAPPPPSRRPKRGKAGG